MQIITRALSPRKEEKRKEKEKRKERNELKITSIYIDRTIYKSSFRYFRLYIYIYLSQLLADKTTASSTIFDVPGVENTEEEEEEEAVSQSVLFGGGKEPRTREIPTARGRARTRERDRSESRRVDRRRLENQSNPFDCSETRTAAGRTHMGRQMARTHQRCVSRYRKTPSTYPFRVRRGQHERRPTTKLPHCSHGMLTSPMLISTCTAILHRTLEISVSTISTKSVPSFTTLPMHLCELGSITRQI